MNKYYYVYVHFEDTNLISRTLTFFYIFGYKYQLGTKYVMIL